MISKVAAVGVAATMVGTTIMGAMAATLDNLPAPFVQNGVANFQFVLGAQASTQDLAGAIDIATALQAANVVSENVNIPGSSTGFSSSAGRQIAQAGDSLNLGEAFDLGTDFKFTRQHFPVLLADGTVEDQDANDDWDYRQEIRFGSAPKVMFGRPSGDNSIHMPQLYVDFGTNADAAYTFYVDFTTTANLANLQDSETIELFGKPFTFNPSNSASASEVTLFGSDVQIFLDLNEPQTLTVDGQTYEVEVVGANSDNQNIVLSVNGQRQTLLEGQTRTINGIEIFVKDVFVTNVPTLNAAATIFVGSEEYKLKTSGTPNRMQLNGDNMRGHYFTLGGTWNATTSMSFEFRPRDLSDNAQRYLLVGETVTDRFLDIDLTFAGVTPALNEMEREFIEFERNGEEIMVSFSNKDGRRYESLSLLERSGTQIRYVQDGTGSTKRLIIAPSELGGSLEEDDFFFTIEGSPSNAFTRVFTVDDITEENNQDLVVFRDLSDSSEYKVRVGERLAATDLVVNTINTGANTFTLNGTGSAKGIVNYFVTDGDMKITLNEVNGTHFHGLTNATFDQITVTVEEDVEGRFGRDNDVDADTWDIGFKYHTDDDIVITGMSGSTYVTEATGRQSYRDFTYYMSDYGTYMQYDNEDDSFFRMWYPREGEASYAVFLTPKGATVSTTGSSSGSITTQRVNPVTVGASIMDTDVNLATPSANLIVMGGPRANSVAFELLGRPTDAEISTMFQPGRAIVKMFDLDNGRVAMLVAGYEWQETQAASRKVAEFDRNLRGEEVMMTVTSLNNVQFRSAQ